MEWWAHKCAYLIMYGLNPYRCIICVDLSGVKPCTWVISHFLRYAIVSWVLAIVGTAEHLLLWRSHSFWRM